MIRNLALAAFAVVFPICARPLFAEKDLVTPPMTDEAPAAGQRVRQVAPEYEGTAVYHSLYLPTDWKRADRYPVLVEYTGNKFPPGKGSGEVKDANLGYGMSGGAGFIWVVMPYVADGRKENAVTWWGDKQATVDYCKTNLPRVCEQFGGDPDNVFVCGFSRGAIGSSYIGLADDDIASLWKGLFTHDHFDGQKSWNYPESDRASALLRLARLRGRPVLICGQHGSTVRDQFLKDHLDLADFTFLDVPTTEIFQIPEGPYIHAHTDLWMHRDSPYRQQARDWLQAALAAKSHPRNASSAAKVLSQSPAARDAQSDAITQEGVWKPKAAVMAGIFLPEAALKAITLKITGGTYEVTVEGEDHSDKGTCMLDTSTTPKRMTIQSTEGPNQGKTFLAIYEMKDAVSMRVCYDLSGTDFPKEFKAPKGTQLYLVGYRRQKE